MLHKSFLLSLILLSGQFISAQHLTMLPDGGNKKASVSERVGLTDVTIHYDRPAVKGREGKIWNGLVHTGFKDLGFGTSKAAPWRAGANENTTFTFTSDVLIEGKPLKAGTYGFFVAMGDKENATLIFSNSNSAWGSFYYDQKQDALRVDVKTVKLNENVERLKYEFMDETENSAVIALLWEKVKIPFKLQVDYVATQLASFRKELPGNEGFKSDAWQKAAFFAASHDTDLEEALQWSDYSLNGPFVGEKNFNNLSTKALVLTKMGNTTEATNIMKQAMPIANMQELHAYGKQLLIDKKPHEALEVFKLNAEKNPGVFTTDMGLVRGYSANGDFSNALKYAKHAQTVAPNNANKEMVSGIIVKLNDHKDIN